MAAKKNEVASTPDPFREFVAKVGEQVLTYKVHFYVAAGILGFLLVSYAGWYIYSIQYDDNARALYERGVAANFRGEGGQKDAIKAFQDVLAKYPRSKSAILSSYLLGNIYFNINDFDAAIRTYKVSLTRVSPGYLLTPLIYTGLGYCYEAKKDYQNAQTAFENSLLDPENNHFLAIGYRNLARSYEELNNPAKAKEYYQKALGLTIDPSHALMLRRKL